MRWYWIILITAFYGFFCAAFAQKNQLHGGIWLFLTWLVGATVPWAWISRHSNNLMFDGLLYDVSLMFFFYLTLCLVANQKINFLQYVSVAVCVIGVLGFKYFEK